MIMILAAGRIRLPQASGQGRKTVAIGQRVNFLPCLAHGTILDKTGHISGDILRGKQADHGDVAHLLQGAEDSCDPPAWCLRNTRCTRVREPRSFPNSPWRSAAGHSFQTPWGEDYPGRSEVRWNRAPVRRRRYFFRCSGKRDSSERAGGRETYR